jgi:TRAP-type uncharacterized transport system fused permease subunit
VPAPLAVAVIEQFEQESPTRRLEGAAGRIAALLALALALYALYWVVAIVAPQVYRPSFLLLALVLTFLLYPARSGAPSRTPSPLDLLMVALTLAALAWPILDRARLPYRAATPSAVDMLLGCVAILLVLEATRRTVGLVLPATAAAFLLYAFIGPWLDEIGLDAIAHRGYGVDRVVGPAVHDARRDLRRAAGRGRDLHRAFHDLRRRARALGRRPLLHRLGDGRHFGLALRRRPRAHR